MKNAISLELSRDFGYFLRQNKFFTENFKTTPQLLNYSTPPLKRHPS